MWVNFVVTRFISFNLLYIVMLIKILRILEFYTLSGFLLDNRKFSLKLCINFKLESVVKFSKDESI